MSIYMFAYFMLSKNYFLLPHLCLMTLVTSYFADFYHNFWVLNDFFTSQAENLSGLLIMFTCTLGPSRGYYNMFSVSIYHQGP